MPVGLLIGAAVVLGGELQAAPAEWEVRVREVDAYRSAREAPAAPRIPSNAYAMALDGEIASGIIGVEGNPAAKGWGLMVMDLPVENLWATVNDEEQQGGEMPVSVSVLLEGKRWQEKRVVFQYLPLPFPISDRWWATRLHYAENLFSVSGGTMWEMYFEDLTPTIQLPPQYAEMVDGAVGVAFTHGAWLLIPLDEKHTLVEYYVWSDPGGLLPAGPASKFAAGAVVETLETMERLGKIYGAQGVKSGRVKRPDGTVIGR